MHTHSIHTHTLPYTPRSSPFPLHPHHNPSLRARIADRRNRPRKSRSERTPSSPAAPPSPPAAAAVRRRKAKQRKNPGSPALPAYPTTTNTRRPGRVPSERSSFLLLLPLHHLPSRRHKFLALR
ncbi:hypothetical protein GQ607_010809 [Colletotrichum asianum]|uniref:Uncharacterized protein n=1 Tax=Colletotrichum asianum TaxID=702518 RepID=A0A8H3W9Y6_9PEZI|nr:hypothetical protein GQ607_010809 [Colletotrichum asianum]